MIFWSAAFIGGAIGWLLAHLWLRYTNFRLSISLLSGIIQQPNTTDEQWDYWKSRPHIGQALWACKEQVEKLKS